MRRVAQTRFAHFQNPLRALQAIGLRHLRPQIQPHVHRQLAVVVEDGLHVGHVATVLPAADAPAPRLLPPLPLGPPHESQAATHLPPHLPRYPPPPFPPPTPPRSTAV